jgi:mannose-1-phosphate guanylyltransferase
MGFYAVIMSGGRGTRLWPKSRKHRPKQVLPLNNEKSLFQSATNRILPLFGYDNILVATGKDHYVSLHQQEPNIPKKNFIIEPEGKGTAPCIGLAAIHLMHRDPNAIMAVLTADHVIRKEKKFREALTVSRALAEKGYLITLGIKPTQPSTGYGYIKQGDLIKEIRDFKIYYVEQFTEKPDAKTAQEMIESQVYSWNSGMFIWRVDIIMNEFKRQMPVLYSQLMDLYKSSEYTNKLKNVWPKITKETIDYGIMENAKNVLVIPVEISWSDIGSWSTFAELLTIDENKNSFIGNIISIDTSNTLALSDKRLISIIGLKNMVIVDTDDALLICPKNRTQEVKEIVRKLEKEAKVQYL